jgi:hypothetical protein
MSLADFQRAMADLSGSPAFCRQTHADPDDTLRAYALTDRERTRLASVAGQAGMAVNCTIHRTTRLVPLDTLLPLTCAALRAGPGGALGAELDAYWSGASRPAIRFETEAARFVAHLENRVEHGRNAWPCPSVVLVELARLELATETLRITPRSDLASDGSAPGRCAARHRLHPDARMIHLDHAPDALLAGARTTPPDLSSVPRRPSVVVLIRDAASVSVFTAPPDRARDLEALTCRGVAAGWLLEFGLAVRG